MLLYPSVMKIWLKECKSELLKKKQKAFHKEEEQSQWEMTSSKSPLPFKCSVIKSLAKSSTTYTWASQEPLLSHRAWIEICPIITLPAPSLVDIAGINLFFLNVPYWSLILRLINNQLWEREREKLYQFQLIDCNIIICNIWIHICAIWSTVNLSKQWTSALRGMSV